MRRTVRAENSQLGSVLLAAVSCQFHAHHQLLVLAHCLDQLLEFLKRHLFLGCGILPLHIGKRVEVLLTFHATFLTAVIADQAADLVEQNRAQQRHQHVAIFQLELVPGRSTQESPKRRLDQVVGVQSTPHSPGQVSLG